MSLSSKIWNRRSSWISSPQIARIDDYTQISSRCRPEKNACSHDHHRCSWGDPPAFVDWLVSQLHCIQSLSTASSLRCGGCLRHSCVHSWHLGCLSLTPWRIVDLHSCQRHCLLLGDSLDFLHLTVSMGSCHHLLAFQMGCSRHHFVHFSCCQHRTQDARYQNGRIYCRPGALANRGPSMPAGSPDIAHASEDHMPPR